MNRTIPSLALGLAALFAASTAAAEVHTVEVRNLGSDGQRMVFELSGGIAGEIDIGFADADGGTEVTYSAKYELPGGVLAAVAEPIARRFNRRQLEKTLRTLQARLETDSPESGK